jgi:curved DNA-binding protein CbpA
MSLYAILGLDPEPEPTPADVKRAYRNAAKTAHPDKGGSDEKLRAIVLARDVLSDAERKKKYDHTGEVDEKSVDNSENHALVKAMSALEFVFAECDRRNLRIEEIDVIQDARIKIEQELSEIEEQRKAARETADRFRKLAERFHERGGKVNRISPMIDGKAAEVERNIERMNEPIAIMKRAIEILAEHSYDVDDVGESLMKRVAFANLSQGWR